MNVGSCPRSEDYRRVRARKLSFALLAGLLLVVSFLLAYRGPLPTWGDEAFTYRISLESWQNVNNEIRNDVHPPLYFWLSRVSGGIFGPGSIRYFAEIIFLLLVWQTIRLAKRRIGAGNDIILPALLIVSSAHLHLFGPMMRYYSLAALGVVTSTLLLLPPLKLPDIFGEKPILHRSVWYAVYLWIGLASSYITAAVIPAHLIYILTRPKSDRNKLLLALLIVILLFLPLIPLLLSQMEGIGGGIWSWFPSILITAIPRLFYTVYSFMLGEFIRPWDWWISVPSFISFCWLVYLAWKARSRPLGGMLWLVLTISAILGAMALALTGVGVEFCASRLFFLAPLFLILLGYGVTCTNPGTIQAKIGYLAIAVIVAANIVSTYNFHNRTNFIQSTYIIPWDEISRDVQTYATDSTLILTDDETLNYWLPENLATNCRIGNIDYLMVQMDRETVEVIPDRIIVVYSPRTLGQDTHERIAWMTLDARKEYIREDETSVRYKSMLLRRPVYEVKKFLIVYNTAG